MKLLFKNIVLVAVELDNDCISPLIVVDSSVSYLNLRKYFPFLQRGPYGPILLANWIFMEVSILDQIATNIPN